MRRLRRRIRATWLCGWLALSACALWAFRPLAAPRAEGAEWQLPEEPADAGLAAVAHAFDAQAFDVELWNPHVDAADEAPAAAAPAPAARPFRLQLVGVTQEDGELFAALYDPEEDQLFIVRDGDRVARHQVMQVTLAGVTLNDGRISRELRLAEPGR